jgi:GntR family transcriptional regulator
MRASLPLYVQIESVLRQRIRSGHYAAGCRFPTDERLCGEFEVSRATVRLALDPLHREGLIVRYPAAERSCNDLRAWLQVLRFEGSVERVIAHGDSAGTEHLVVDRVVAPAVLPGATGARLDVRVGHVYPSIASMLIEPLGLKICEVRQVISAALANPGIARALDIAVGVPILTIRRTHYGDGGTPLELAVTSYPADRYQYEAVIAGLA